MSKLVLTALMGLGLLMSGHVMAQEEDGGGVPKDVTTACNDFPNYKEFVCDSVVAKVNEYNTNFKPPAAFLDPQVSDDRGGQVGGAGGGASSGGDDYIQQGFDEGSGGSPGSEYDGLDSGGMQ